MYKIWILTLFFLFTLVNANANTEYGLQTSDCQKKEPFEGQSYWLNPIVDVHDPCLESKYHWSTFGNEFFPVGFVELPYYDQAKKQFSGKKLKDLWEKWGFTVDKKVSNTLAVGFAITPSALKKGSHTIGFNCAACHTAKYTYKGSDFYINGAPARLDILNFAGDMYDSFLQLYKKENEGRLNQFLQEAVPYHLDAAKVPINWFTRFFAKIALRKGLWELRAKIMESRIADDKAAKRISKERNRPDVKTLYPIPFGPGRADAFNLGSNLLFRGVDDKNLDLVDAPVSIPALWNSTKFDMAQWNAGISGSLYRNILAAIAIRTPVELKPGENQFWTSADLREINNQEKIISKILPPVWPERILGKLDQEKVYRGRHIYQTKCMSCHEPVKHDLRGEEFWELKKFHPRSIGVDDKFKISYNQRKIDGRKLFEASGTSITLRELFYYNYDSEQGVIGKIREYPEVVNRDLANLSLFNMLNFTVGKVLNRAFIDQKITDQEIKEMKKGLYSSEQDAFYVNDSAYVKALPLDGVWATSPYLHNNSVRTLRELLTDERQRPQTFRVGSLEYDPVNVGMKNEGQFIFNTAEYGNKNTGHSGEEFGTNLSNEDKEDLLEYLKSI